MFDHFYIFSTIVFTVYSQLIIRWQVLAAGELPNELSGKLYFVTKLLLNPWVISSMVATFLAGVSWMLTMSKFDISYAYPWIALNFVLIFIFGLFLFDEPYSAPKILGTVIIVIGVLVLARG